MITLFQIIHYFTWFLYSLISESWPLPGLTLGVLLIPIEGKSEPCWISIYIPVFFKPTWMWKPQHFWRKTIVFPDLCWMLVGPWTPWISAHTQEMLGDKQQARAMAQLAVNNAQEAEKNHSSAWCFGTWTDYFSIFFPYILGISSSSQLTLSPSFFRGVSSKHQLDNYGKSPFFIGKSPFLITIITIFRCGWLGFPHVQQQSCQAIAAVRERGKDVRGSQGGYGVHMGSHGSPWHGFPWRNIPRNDWLVSVSRG
jgi:hypothetical protein